MKKGTAEWLDFAKRDLEAASLLVHNEYVANAVLFHSQQCIEKCFKAILEERECPVPKIHSVIKLYATITDQTSFSVSITEEDMDLVDLVYIDSRYPSGLGMLPSGFPTSKDASELLKIAQTVYKEVSQQILKI